MEVNGDENFYLEWRIENFCCWNKHVHSPAISTNGLQIGDVIFDLVLFPRGFSGSDIHMVLQIYDDSASYGVVYFLPADRSRIYCAVKITPVWVGGFLIVKTKLRFQTVLNYATKEAWHEDALILRYCGKSRRPFYSFGTLSLKTVINVFDSNFIIPSEKVVASLSTINNLADISSLQNEEIGHFKLLAYCKPYRDRLVVFKLSLRPEQIVDETLVKCYLYMVRDERSLRLSVKYYIFKSNVGNPTTCNFCTFLSLEELLKGSHVTARLKIVSDNRVYSEGFSVWSSKKDTRSIW